MSPRADTFFMLQKRQRVVTCKPLCLPSHSYARCGKPIPPISCSAPPGSQKCRFTKETDIRMAQKTKNKESWRGGSRSSSTGLPLPHQSTLLWRQKILHKIPKRIWQAMVCKVVPTTICKSLVGILNWPQIQFGAESAGCRYHNNTPTKIQKLK